jgi:hypothetical protein
LWTLSSYLLLSYCILLGTLEEQFFYFLILPCILTVAVGATRIGSLLGTTPRRRRGLHVGLLTLAVLFVGWNGRQWAIRHFTPDNGEERVLQYIAQQVPPRSRVAATNETAQFLLGPRTSGPWGQWADVAQLEQAAPDYLIVTPRTLAWNFGPAAQPLLRWIAQHGQAVFTFNGQGGETTILYRLSNQH